MPNEINILVIEDNSNDYQLLKEDIDTAEELTATMYKAERLQDGFSIMENNRIDLAIIDLNLPDSDGLKTFLAFHRKYSSVPAVILSGRKDDDLAMQAVRGGAQDYVVKGEPSRTAMSRIIRYAIERQRWAATMSGEQDQVEELPGLLPMCSYCYKIRDERGGWDNIENYIYRYFDASVTHSICPECIRTNYPDLYSSILPDEE